MGFVWDVLQEDFDRGLEELAAYVRAHGDARVPPSYSGPSGFRLGKWCATRRGWRKADTLGAKRVAAMDTLGFVWNPRKENFDRGLEELAAYVRAHGDARVPTGHLTSSGFKLGCWSGKRRSERRAGKLGAERVAALDALGFVWDVLADDFDRGLAELAAYVDAHGDAQVPWKHTTSSGLRLGSWCNTRRMDRRAGKLSAERVAALDGFGFVWDARRTRSVRSGTRSGERS